MAYLQSISAQAAVFLKTVGFGFLLGSAYDLVRFVRLLTRSRRVAAWDVGFGAAAGIAAFLFLLTQNGGKVRVFLLVAIGVGFCAWVLTAGRQLRAATDGALRAAHRAAVRLCRPFRQISVWLGKAGERLRRRLKKG